MVSHVKQVSMEENTTAHLSLSSRKDESTGMGFFTYQETLHLIECVRKKPKLWHRQFLRKRASSCVTEWNDIQQHEFPSYTVNQLKVRWKTMRDCFRRELKRLESGHLTKSRWPLYEHMKFLDGQFRLKSNVRHKAPPGTVSAKRHLPSTPSKESMKVEVAENISPATGGTQASEMLDEQSGRLIIVDAEDAPGGVSEVTFCNKFRSRIRSDPLTEGENEACNERGHNTTDSQFLMSLVPFLNILPIDKNLEIRLKMLQLLANATQNMNAEERKY
ncbi:uncharacterized protein LOC126567523 [Anopheles maculipalpis]|uniref:uncharacterized protein LOC126567523 n=1 Tax=Anopheles maculipalpis TaxID=1496333 RepID=UPI002158E743|nr:uncharacterized protein LOC126567523 [Anopheles maculipalpis]